MDAMNRLKDFLKAIDKSVGQLRVEGPFKEEFMKFVKLVHSPFGKAILESNNIDTKIVDTIFNGLLYDKQVKDITGTIANIFECFSVDRYVGVESEQEMEDFAVQMNKKKLFLAGIFFDNDGQGGGPYLTEHAYKLRMDMDNTPITLENRNRLWFPGADGNFELQMRYHRGFIQIQHLVDQAITKTLVDLENERLEQDWNSTNTVAPTTKTSIWGEDDDYEDEDEEEEVPVTPTTQATEIVVTLNLTDTETTEPSETIDTEAQTTMPSSEIIQSTTVPIEIANGTQTAKDADLSIRDERPQNAVTDWDKNEKRRKKRAPQVDFFSLFSGGSGNESMDNKFIGGIKLPDQDIHTKQFPYPKYRQDTFVTGLYLAQSIQLAFFFALIIQVSAAVRHRIWMRESGNSTVSEFRLSF